MQGITHTGEWGWGALGKLGMQGVIHTGEWGWQRSGALGKLETLGIGDAGVFGDSRTGDSPVPSACAIRALLLEVLPILGPPSSLTRIVLSRDELLHKILELLQLLPPTLLGLQVGTWGGLSSPTILGLQVGGTRVACHPFSVSPAVPA